MYFNYKFKPTLVNKIRYITHKHKNFNYHLQQQAHRWHEIIYVDYGKMHLILSDRHITISPGECIFIPAMQKHEFWGDADLPFNFLNVGYSGYLPESLHSVILSTGREHQKILEKIKQQVNIELPLNIELMACMLTEFIYWMAYNKEIPQARGIAPANQKLYQSSAVQRALELIEKEYHTKITLQKVSMTVGLSESRLRMLIRQETGKNFSYHLQNLRIEAAKHLLRHSLENIQDIAASVGYDSTPFFFKVFRRFTGMTPLEYAKTLGDAEEE